MIVANGNLYLPIEMCEILANSPEERHDVSHRVQSMSSDKPSVSNFPTV